MKLQLITIAACIGFILFGGCENSSRPVETSSIQLVKDELEIRALAEKFSDAANRKDSALFQSLWAKEAVWSIGPPINVEFKGKENMGSSVTRMLGLWDFFVQLSGPGVVKYQWG